MAEQIKGLATRNAEPAKKVADKPKPEEPKEVEEVKEEADELSEEELAARKAREDYLRMWPLEAVERR